MFNEKISDSVNVNINTNTKFKYAEEKYLIVYIYLKRANIKKIESSREEGDILYQRKIEKKRCTNVRQKEKKQKIRLRFFGKKDKKNHKKKIHSVSGVEFVE